MTLPPPPDWLTETAASLSGAMFVPLMVIFFQWQYDAVGMSTVFLAFVCGAAWGTVLMEAAMRSRHRVH